MFTCALVAAPFDRVRSRLNDRCETPERRRAVTGMRSGFAVLATAAALTVPAAASASTAFVDPDAPGTAVFRSGPAASDVFALWPAGGGVQFTDALQPVVAGQGCTAGPPVTCPLLGPGPGLDIRLGPGDDRFNSTTLRIPLTLTGGPGHDAIRAKGETNHVAAGPGDDDVWANSNGGRDLKGNAGDDRMFAWEGDEGLDGGAGDDLLVAGSTRFNNLLTGGAGADEIVIQAPGGGTASGGAGTDVIAFDIVVPFIPSYTIDGGPGPDIIAGSAGVDTVQGGAGADVIGVGGDGQVDTVDCGPGHDVVYADAADVVSGCEIRVEGALPDLPQVSAARAHAQAFVDEQPA